MCGCVSLPALKLGSALRPLRVALLGLGGSRCPECACCRLLPGCAPCQLLCCTCHISSLLSWFQWACPFAGLCMHLLPPRERSACTRTSCSFIRFAKLRMKQTLPHRCWQQEARPPTSTCNSMEAPAAPVPAAAGRWQRAVGRDLVAWPVCCAGPASPASRLCQLDCVTSPV